MIVTVKAWLHADRAYALDGGSNTIFRLNSFSSPLTEDSVPIREMSFEILVDDNFDRAALVAARKAETLREKLARAKKNVEDLERVLGKGDGQ